MKMFPHQIKGSDYLIERGGGYLFWKMRVGKTLPAIDAVMKHAETPVLIITQTSIMETWRKTLVHDYGVPENLVSVCKTNYMSNKRRHILETGFIVICNYDMAIPYRIMTAQQWGAIIYDESHAIANMSAKRTRYIVRSVKKQPKHQIRLALSGTPAPEGDIQYVSQFFAVDGHFMGHTDLPKYIQQYWMYMVYSRRWEIHDIEHEMEFKDYINKNAFFLSLENLGKGSEILKTHREIPVNSAQLDCLDWAIERKEDLNRLFRGFGQSPVGDMVYGMYENMVAAGIDPRDRSIISTRKAQDIVYCYHDNPEPILILCPYVDIIPVIAEVLNKRDIRTDWFDGSKPEFEREEIRDRFQRGGLDAVVAQSAIAAEGLDFSRADKTYYYSNLFSLRVREQTSQRTTNLNKTRPVELVDLCTTHTMDLNVVKKLEKKEKVSSAFIREHSRLI